jgi:hypothetical protein
MPTGAGPAAAAGSPISSDVSLRPARQGGTGGWRSGVPALRSDGCRKDDLAVRPRQSVERGCRERHDGIGSPDIPGGLLSRPERQEVAARMFSGSAPLDGDLTLDLDLWHGVSLCSVRVIRGRQRPALYRTSGERGEIPARRVLLRHIGSKCSIENMGVRETRVTAPSGSLRRYTRPSPRGSCRRRATSRRRAARGHPAPRSSPRRAPARSRCG